MDALSEKMSHVMFTYCKKSSMFWKWKIVSVLTSTWKMFGGMHPYWIVEIWTGGEKLGLVVEDLINRCFQFIRKWKFSLHIRKWKFLHPYWMIEIWRGGKKLGLVVENLRKDVSNSVAFWKRTSASWQQSFVPVKPRHISWHYSWYIPADILGSW